jgi:hypothetical protein
MQCVIRRPQPNVQIGNALLKSKAREFTGFGEDSFLPSQFRCRSARWEVGKGGVHYRELSCPKNGTTT